MPDRRSNPDAPTHDLIQARRIEIVDDFGTPRLVLGDLSLEADRDHWPGLVIRDAYGHDRAWLILDPDGVQLDFDLDGNTIASFGVLDHHTLAPGARLTLCDGQGATVLYGNVAPDGSPEVTSPEA